jgi:lauroyl/myristoyl acyltransferase
VTLHQLTGAPVLPLLHHLAGRRHVMTIHPPLPSLESDPPTGLEIRRDHLTRLVEDYVRRFPEQCPTPGPRAALDEVSPHGRFRFGSS